uniref:SH3 domain-containing protein n=1 Tax=Xiphophorus couchianus TaxID=32473 RepID=A0A3B5KR33_9TELE
MYLHQPQAKNPGPLGNRATVRAGWNRLGAAAGPIGLTTRPTVCSVSTVYGKPVVPSPSPVPQDEARDGAVLPPPGVDGFPRPLSPTKLTPVGGFPTHTGPNGCHGDRPGQNDWQFCWLTGPLSGNQSLFWSAVSSAHSQLRYQNDADLEVLRRRLSNAPRPLKKRSSITEPEVQRLDGNCHPAVAPRQSILTQTPSSAATLLPWSPGCLCPQAKRTNLKKPSSERTGHSLRVKFNPLALLLDASLEGEFDLVQRVENPSMPNDEGITPLHNAVCAGHHHIVKFLLDFGVNVNAADSDGWTPLHCAASCNSVHLCKMLVESGAAIFATTISDVETAADKCEEMEEGYSQCSQFLYGVQEKLGVMNKGVAYALWDYVARRDDELSFGEGDAITVLSRHDDTETDWWWARLDDREGYVARNLLGVRQPSSLMMSQRSEYLLAFSGSSCSDVLTSLQLYPRIKPRQRSLA